MLYYEVVDWVWRGQERWHLEDVVDADGEDLTWEFCRLPPLHAGIPTANELPARFPGDEPSRLSLFGAE